VRAGVQQVLFVTLVQCGQMLGCSALMVWTDVWLFFGALAIAPFVWLLNRIFRQRLAAAYRAQSDSYSRISATMAESVSGIRVTQSFSRQEINDELFHDLVADHARYNFASAKAGGQFLPLLELCTQGFLASLLLIGGWRALQPDIAMPIGTVIQFFFLAGLFFQPITVLGQLFNEALTAMAGAEKLFHVLDTEPAWKDRARCAAPSSLARACRVRERWLRVSTRSLSLARHLVQGRARHQCRACRSHRQRQDHLGQFDCEVPSAHTGNRAA